MNKRVLTQRMSENISKYMIQTPHTVEPLGYISHLKKNIFSVEEDKSQSFKALEFLEEWVTRDCSQPYCALLGEYGLGKTTTCMLFTKRLLEKGKSHPSLPLPIYLDLRHVDVKHHNPKIKLISIIDTVLQRMYEGHSELCSQKVIRLVQEEGALVIFDGLDEVLVHLSFAAGQHFMRTLLSILPPRMLKTSPHDTTNRKGKVAGRLLLTCRTHYFRTTREQNTHFLMEDRGGINAEDYCAFILLPFTHEQIHEYLAYSLPDLDTDNLLALINSVHNLSEMAERPYTLSLIPALIPQIERWKMQGSQVTGATIYRHMVLSWLERDKDKHRITPEHKLKMMEYFAAELWKSGKKLWNINDVENWLVLFLHTKPTIAAHYYTQDKNKELLHHILDMLKEDLRTATFLVRVGEANFHFAHTSLQEFFLATYLYHALMEKRIEAWNMVMVNQETLDFLGQLLSEGDNHFALTMLKTIQKTYQPHISELAFAYMLLAHAKGYPTPGVTNINLDQANLKEWNILGQPNKPLNLQGASFRGAQLANANLRRLNLNQADFSNATLTDAELTDSQAHSACFNHADLTKANFRYVHLQNATFLNATLHQAKWTHCNLTASNLLENISPSALFIMCQPPEINSFQSAYTSHTHQSVINACMFSPDGQWLASASWDHTLRLWNTQTGECLKTLYHEAPINDCAFSPDGTTLISAVADKTLHIWNSFTGKRLNILNDHESTIRGCSFSPSGTYFASVSDDQTLRIWETQTQRCFHILKGHSGSVRSSTFSPDGQHIASTSNDLTLRVWNLLTGECLCILQGHTDWIRRCAFSPDGRYLISASGDRTLRLWDLMTHKCVHVLYGHTKKVRQCLFSADGRSLISCADDQTLRVWDIATQKCVRILKGHQDKVRACALSSSGYIASASDDQTLRLWDIVSGTCLRTFGKISP